MSFEKHKAYIAMILIQFIYTGMALFSKAAISDGGMKSSIFVAYRQAFATIALAPFAYFFESNKAPPLSRTLLLKIFFVATTGVTLTLNLYYFGMKFVSATFATAMTNTIPVMVFIMAVCLRMESLSLNKWHGIAKVLGSVVGLSGAMVFTFYKGPALYAAVRNESSDHSTTSHSTEDWIKGAILMLSSNLTWALWLIMQGPILKQYPAKICLTTLQCGFSCIMSALLAVVTERDLASWKLGWNLNLLSVVYCGIIVTGITYWLQVWVVDKKGPVFTAVFSPLALLLTAIFSAIIFKENLRWGSVFGGLLLVVGLYSFLWGKNKETKVKANGQTKETVALNCISCSSVANEPAKSETSHEQTKEQVPLESITCTTTTTTVNNEPVKTETSHEQTKEQVPMESITYTTTVSNEPVKTETSHDQVPLENVTCTLGPHEQRKTDGVHH